MTMQQQQQHNSNIKDDWGDIEDDRDDDDFYENDWTVSSEEGEIRYNDAMNAECDSSRNYLNEQIEPSPFPYGCSWDNLEPIPLGAKVAPFFPRPRCSSPSPNTAQQQGTNIMPGGKGGKMGKTGKLDKNYKCPSVCGGPGGYSAEQQVEQHKQQQRWGEGARGLMAEAEDEWTRNKFIYSSPQRDSFHFVQPPVLGSSSRINIINNNNNRRSNNNHNNNGGGKKGYYGGVSFAPPTPPPTARPQQAKKSTGWANIVGVGGDMFNNHHSSSSSSSVPNDELLFGGGGLGPPRQHHSGGEEEHFTSPSFIPHTNSRGKANRRSSTHYPSSSSSYCYNTSSSSTTTPPLQERAAGGRGRPPTAPRNEYTGQFSPSRSLPACFAADDLHAGLLWADLSQFEESFRFYGVELLSELRLLLGEHLAESGVMDDDRTWMRFQKLVIRATQVSQKRLKKKGGVRRRTSISTGSGM